MPDAVLGELARLGTMSPFLALMGWFIWRQDKHIRGVEAARIADSKVANDKLLTAYEKNQQIITANALAMESNKQALTELRATMADMEDVMLDITRLSKIPMKK